ncbi:MAG: transcriptional regulator NrdR [Planctomycetes bacterium]|nr:transcriptional regulator NrdR [Planctomycetota bacterium]
MRCPFCKADNGRVIDSRSSSDGFSIRRRRECLDCSRRFTTYERMEETPLRVVKKDGSRVPFDRNQILKGLLKACEKRPVSLEQLEEITSSIERGLTEMFDREVGSKYIGQLVMDALKQLDQVAYVRFASVYREFKDVEQFIEELKPFLQSNAGLDGGPHGTTGFPSP